MKSLELSLFLIFPFICSFKQINRKTLHAAPLIVVPPASKDSHHKEHVLGPFWTTASWLSPRKQSDSDLFSSHFSLSALLLPKL